MRRATPRPSSPPGPPAGEAVRYAITDSRLGRVLVAHGATGVHAVLIDDDDAALAADLRTRLPHAALTAGGEESAALAARVVACIEHGEPAFDAPLAARGTPFQQAVWTVLRAVPPGETVSYTEIARRVGRPDAVRAVAGAIAANPIAVLVPCHRVVRSDGSLSGYRWGVARKRALLEREARRSATPVHPS